MKKIIKLLFYLLILSVGLFLIFNQKILNFQKSSQNSLSVSKKSPQINVNLLNLELTKQVTNNPDTAAQTSLVAYDSQTVFGVYTYQQASQFASKIFRVSYLKNNQFTNLQLIDVTSDYRKFVPEISDLLANQLTSLIEENQKNIQNSSPKVH